MHLKQTSCRVSAVTAHALWRIRFSGMWTKPWAWASRWNCSIQTRAARTHTRRMWQPSLGAETPSTVSRTPATGQVPPNIIIHPCALNGLQTSPDAECAGQCLLGSWRTSRRRAHTTSTTRACRCGRGKWMLLAFACPWRPATIQSWSRARRQCGDAGACSAAVPVELGVLQCWMHTPRVNHLASAHKVEFSCTPKRAINACRQAHW